MGMTLGPFDLHEIAGRGGMGEVWRGTHRALGVPVAVKVLTSANARDELFAAAFRNEARAVAALAHPNVIGIFDYGEVPPGVGALTERSPYLVTEWAPGGTLAQRPPREWPDLLGALLALLGALAHAHARGVIHRDLKPGNVLYVAEDARGLKLVDFGIARAEGDEGTTALTGTPAYMAPEQILGAARDEGPWTDLYALGCLAYRLASGRTPFAGTPVEIASGHLQRPAPPLAPTMPVPDGFDAWLHTLLAKDPRARFRLAADAALALRRLGPPLGDAPPPPRSSPDAVTLVVTGDSLTSIDVPPVVDAAALSAPPALAEIPAVPETWDATTDVRSELLPGTGLGVFGVRDVPMVDRARERDELWSALRAVADGGVRAIVLRGPSGCGKSRLARWLGERANELGVATLLKVSHDEGQAATDRVGPSLARWLRTHGLGEDDARARVAAALEAHGADEEDVRAVLRLVRGGRFGGSRERYETARRLLAGASVERPLVVWIDDAQWGEDALAFVQHALDGPKGGRVLFVVTLREDVRPSRGVAELLAALRGRADVGDVAIGPLPIEHRAELVRGLLGLDGALAREVEERTMGSPLFAVQLVGDWVGRGVLEPAARGYRLREGVKASIPEDVATVWRTRVDEVLRDRPASEGAALELAALLGHAIEPSEWEATCAAAGLVAPWPLVERLLDLRFATCAPDGPRAGWELAHGMLREGLERRAHDAGRLRAHHAACARSLAARGAEAERLGRHLRAAGEPRAALAPLLEGARARVARGEGRMARVLLGELEIALREAGIATTDPWWARAWALEATVVSQSGATDEALALAERAERAAAAHASTSVRAEALLARARVLVKQARPDQAEVAAREALALLRVETDERATCEALHWIGIARVEAGDAAGARAIQLEALAAAEAAADRVAIANAHYELGLAERQLGMRESSEQHLRAALAINEALDRAVGMANTFVALGENARVFGELDAAAELYVRSIPIYERIGSPNTAIARLNHGLVDLARGRWVDARRTLLDARALLERNGWRSMLACAHVEIATAASGAGDWAARDEHFAKAQALLSEGIVADPDLGWAAALAGTLAARAGHVARAREAFALARAQWAALGRPDDVAEVDRAVATLPTS